MPHFMVRRRQVNGPQLFQNGIQEPQTGKRFFYVLDNQGFPVDKNTVINYEASLPLSLEEFQQLIRDITGSQNPTVTKNSYTHHYTHHLDKNNNGLGTLIDINYCTQILGLPNNINGYNLAKIGIAVSYIPARYNDNRANGNVLFIFCDQNNQNNEVCISIHTIPSNQSTNYFTQLMPLLNTAVNSLQPQNNPFWQLKPSDDFNTLGYVVTKGQNQESEYKNAYTASLSYTAKLFYSINAAIKYCC